MRGLRNQGAGGGAGAGGEGAGGGTAQSDADKAKGASQEKIRPMTTEEFLAANPEFKSRLDAGDAAVQEREKAKKEKLTADGDLTKLLETEREEKTKQETKAKTVEAENKTLKRTIEIRDYLDTAKDLKYPIPAIKKFAIALDDGKKTPEELVKAAVAEMESLGLVPGAGGKTDDLGGGGSGGKGSASGSEDEKIANLIKLGKKAMKSRTPQDLQAYDMERAKVKETGIKLPADLARRIQPDAA